MDKYLNQVVCKSAIDLLRDLPDQSVHCIITSPPYFGLRDYGTAKWEGGDPNCEHRVGNQVEDTKAKGAIVSGVRPGVDASTCILCGAKRIDDQIGLEQTPEQYVDNLVEIFHEARRVLRDSGVLWLNLGDSFWGGKGQSGHANADIQRDRVKRGDSFNVSAAHVAGKGKTRPTDRKHDIIKPKDLVGIPFRVAFALQADGWYWRSTIPWVKRNAMPESVKDRPTSGVEYVFMFSKSQKYYYDYFAIQRPLAESSISKILMDSVENLATGIRFGGNKADGYGNETCSGKKWVAGKTRRYRNTDAFYDSLDILIEETLEYLTYLQKVKENRGVLCDEEGEIIALDIPTRSFKAAHFATFPTTLVEPLLIAGCPERVCDVCGTPYKRNVKRTSDKVNLREGQQQQTRAGGVITGGTERVTLGVTDHVYFQDNGFNSNCECQSRAVPGTVLDFFSGAGTVGLVASQNGRQFICGDLNPEYVEMSQKRILDGSGWS